MDQDRENGWEPTELDTQSSFSDQPDTRASGAPAGPSYVSRQFEFQPIVGPNRQSFGVEMKFRAGWEDANSGPGATSRIMLDNCLLYGFDDLARGRALLLTCTRETLLSGFLSLLPRSVVFQIPESVGADDEVVHACQVLKDAGYRFALVDFESLDAMDGFLDLVDFIKIDFAHPVRRKRAYMMRRLHLLRSPLIAMNIDSEDAFRQAVEEGFELFEGPFCGETATYASRSDGLDPVNCMGILEALDWPDLSIEDLAGLISEEPGIERRILRKAKWTVPPGYRIYSIEDALLVILRADVHKIVNLAIEAASEQCVNQALASEQPPRDTRGDDVLIRWYEMGAKAPWWWSDGNESEVH